MVSFRKWILALTVLTLFAGLANAQLGVSQYSCSTNTSSTPALRSEGYTEQTGDILISCTGGAPLAVGSAVPQVNITVFLNTAVTSRLLPISSGPSNASEALLLIDEPGSGVPSIIGAAPFGVNAPQSVCPYSALTGPQIGCAEVVSSFVPTAGPTCPTVGPCTPIAVATNTAQGTAATSAGYNIFQGIVQNNSVTFFGIPVLPPTTTGLSRVYRITNIRANATSLGGGSAAGAAPVIASIVVSNPAALPITQATPTIGFVQPGLTAGASGASNFNQCINYTRAAVSLLTFTENFGTAFKTRVAATTNSLYSGQGISLQNVPGVLYNSESNFVLNLPAANGGGSPGLTDYGTRLKAQFNAIPSGVRLWVSTTNVLNNALPFVNAVPGGNAANSGTTPTGLLVTSETVPDGTGSGFFPAIPTGTDQASTGNTPIVEIPVVNGSATAVWEVVNTNPNVIESIRFGVYLTSASNVAQNSPLPGTATVNLSYAPTPGTGAASAFAAASSSLTIPRFVGDTAAARNLFNVNICRTILLYPFVTSAGGFDTGLSIANTSTDPFGTGPQSGACKLNWYQGASNPPPSDTGTIASGTLYVNLASTLVPGFNGYMIAVCNFQFAHGFAAVSDLGSRNFISVYLALVIPDPGTGSRAASGLDEAAAGTGENIAH